MHAWKQLRGEIVSATRLNFERLALSLLRLMWPDLFRPPEGDQLDRADIDLAGNRALERLKVRLRGGEIADRELQLLRHPVFLQMIAALAANGEQAGTTAAEVLAKWRYLKISRDLEADRVVPSDIYDAAELCTQLGNS